FGSFNPVHTGHMIIAQHLANQSEIDQVWMIISPHNPLKEKHSLANDYDRLHLVQLAVEDNPKIQASAVEFKLPKPSYTIDTLAHLKEKFPMHVFSLIMGGDNLASLTKWKNYELILQHHLIYIYNRPGTDPDQPHSDHPNIRYCQAPLLDLSSTYIRQAIKDGRSIRYLVPDKVFDYLEGSRMFK
ncbi:MAG TPA: nicotinate (nicotinamide) nucleotide adenylyltransferase, partial [Saprospiraceae bacterium]|nr:nicotinate (nicotinamide) nucleotide adenylyltransferase [Saprospiraceae bacterium]